ncbi:MAG TPA: glycosyltransferase family 1 protein [Acidimicrobiales bacterium]|jgi:glycosyltransferase involved in cell wall biosynthesis
MSDNLVPVVYDDQVFTFNRRGGVARYFTELLRIYREDPGLGVEALTPFRYTVTEHLLELDPLCYRRAPLPEVLQRPRVLRPLNRMVARRSAESAHLMHHTHYFPQALTSQADHRVCTIYDMIPELFPEQFLHGNPHQAKRQYVDVCDAILCISQSTKDDLLRVYGTLDKPVVVTPLGVADHFFDARPEADCPEYVLYVGQRFDYKNFDVLLRSMALLGDTRPALSLVCVGPPFTETELANQDELGVRSRVVRRAADDHELPTVYASARCFVFPSRYEGFGLPIVEAFAAGCPTIVADMPCSIEVGGDSVLTFSTDDAEGLAVMIDRLVGDAAERERLAAAGRLRARTFSWRRTAELTRDVYREVSRS